MFLCLARDKTIVLQKKKKRKPSPSVPADGASISAGTLQQDTHAPLDTKKNVLQNLGRADGHTCRFKHYDIYEDATIR